MPSVAAAAGNAPGDRIDGRWDAIVEVGKAPVPFRLDLATNGKHATGYFFDGTRPIPSSAGTFENGNLHLHFDLYNTDLTAKVDGDTLRGAYIRHLATKDTTRGFSATRFRDSPASGDEPSLAGDWQLRSPNPKAQADWKMVLQQKGGAVTGAILRLDGDTGALTGTFHGGKLTLSHFSGARPALLEGELKPDGTLDLVLDRELKLTGVREGSEQAKGITPAFDAFHATAMKNPQAPFRFSGPDVDGHVITSGDSRFRGKVVLLSIGGTWCPNCMDEAPFLVDLYRRYHDRGFEIVGLNFESGDEGYDRKRLRVFLAKYSIPYPVVVAGTTDDANDKLKQLNNFGAYPTTLFVGRDGLVHAIHDGFASVATGAEHVKLKAETDKMVEDLLGQPAR